MANIAKISLPDGNTYDIVDKKSGYYTKPSSGVPKSDLASDVQTSLGKADSALLVTGGTVTGETTFNDDVHLENETYADSVTAGSLLVTGDARFVNGLYGNLKGNADTASSVAWDNVTGKPTSYTPSSHTHDDRYYTESEINTKVSDINSSITSHTGNNSNPHGVTKSQVGLGNVENKSSATIRGELTKSNVTTALGYTPYTPNEVDNKLSALETNIDWKESVDTFGDIATTYPNPVDGWTVNVKDTDYTYRYNGTSWVAISANAIPKATNNIDGLLSKEDHTNYDDANSKKHTHSNKSVLDGISSTNVSNWNSAKTHADSTHARTDATKVEKSSTNGNIKINDTETTVYTHPSGTNPHGTTKSDVGLGNVENKSSATIRSELTKENVTNALGYTPPTTNTTYGVATSSALGLVKSGTDITVDSSGNVSVNDDSHNHVISNVDGLQSALDGKLPLSGGTMNGTIKFNSNSLPQKTLSFVCGIDGFADGGEMGWQSKEQFLSNCSKTNHTHNYAGSSSAGGSATSAVKLDSSAGSATQPVYFSGGKPVATTYTLGASVPSGAVFTDTKNTAGSTDTSSKIFLVGATSQAANPQTYSDNQVYATNGQLNSNSMRIAEKVTMQYNSSTESLDFVFA